MGRGKRYDDTPKLNIKKVIATILVFVVLVMVIISLKNILSNESITKDVTTLTAYVTIFQDNKWGVIDNKGAIVIEPTYEEMIIIPDKNKDVFICTDIIDRVEETYKTKVVNKDGEEILKDYNNITAFENSNSNKVWYEDNVLKYERNGNYGLIDFTGKVLLEPQFSNITVLPGIEKSLIVEKDGKKGLFLVSSNELMINPEYADVKALSEKHEDGYVVKNADGKVGLISLDKKTILEAKYDDIKSVHGNNLYVVTEGGKEEIIDTSGKVVISRKFDSVEEINTNNIILKSGGKYLAISPSDEEILKAEYDNLKYIKGNLYIAEKDGKYGVISEDGQTVVDYKYKLMYYVKDAGIIVAENDDLTSDIYDSDLNLKLSGVIISEINQEKAFLRIRDNGDYKYYNFKIEEKTNKDIYPTNTLFLFKENGKYGYKNLNDAVIVDAKYDDAKEQNEFGYCAVKTDKGWGALKSDGTVVVNPSINLDEYLVIDFINTYHRVNDLNLYVYTK